MIKGRNGMFYMVSDMGSNGRVWAGVTAEGRPITLPHISKKKAEEALLRIIKESEDKK